MMYVNFRPLRSSADVPIVNLSLLSLAVLRTESIKVDKNVGFLVLLVTENVGAGTGKLDIYAEYSDDNLTFYRTYTTDLAGTIAQEGNIVTQLGNSTRRIVHTARLARWVRYVITATADAQVTASATFQEQDSSN